MKFSAILLAFVAALGLASAAHDLNADNFDAEVYESGKHAFVKFLAPW
jgi:hypothetical protein